MSGDVRAPIAVTGWSIHVPGSRLAAALGSAPDPLSCAPESAHELLGRRGLLNKEPATRLALCAVHRAIGRPPGAAREPGPPDSRVAVVASSNLGNVATVQTIARTLRTTGLKDVSALDAPNASSNVLASTVAIWFRCGGPNLMICSGATSGLDAVYLARVLLLADRADRVIVVGAEPGDPVAVSLHARRAA
ncbi:MAG TPA: beta-ketoacyl synthase N-terminal-like domain-containing protein, partial [Micromonosporaceae bacterium]